MEYHGRFEVPCECPDCAEGRYEALAETAVRLEGEVARLREVLRQVRDGMPGYQSTAAHARRMLLDPIYRLIIARLEEALKS